MIVERIKNALPPYFVEKFEGVDEKQVNSLPINIRRKLIHGSKDEFKDALEALRTRERLQKTELLGQAAMELIRDMRQFAKDQKD